ncbi:hypothetical protein QQ045_012903 [Rhodiola kirilowii]
MAEGLEMRGIRFHLFAAPVVRDSLLQSVFELLAIADQRMSRPMEEDTTIWDLGSKSIVEDLKVDLKAEAERAERAERAEETT